MSPIDVQVVALETTTASVPDPAPLVTVNVEAKETVVAKVPDVFLADVEVG